MVLSRHWACGFALLLVVGCGAPQADYQYSTETQTLLPNARKAVKEQVTDKFGSPSKIVAWQRLPIAFGGVPGVVTGIASELETGKTSDTGDETVVNGLEVDFTAPAALVKYDRNLDGVLALGEFPGEIQTELLKNARRRDPVTKKKRTKFAEADADGDGVLNRDELLATIRDKAFDDTLISALDELEDPQTLVGQTVHFAAGGHRDATNSKTVVVTEIEPSTGIVKFWPPLAKPVSTDVRMVIGFGDHLAQGRHLYMRHCMHCHGSSGDGRGPTAEYLYPRPRDYRQGKFKFASTFRNDRPQRDDLHRTLRQGIPGTLMPSFALLKDEEVEQIIEYVRFLSMRGEFEGNLVARFSEFSEKVVEAETKNAELQYAAAMKAWRENDEAGTEPKKTSRGNIVADLNKSLTRQLEPSRFQKTVDRAADDVASKWVECETSPTVIMPKGPRPEDSPESRARGRILYLQKCALCHGETGLGNGPQTLDYGQHPITKENYEQPGLYDDWGQPIKPRNLTLGLYRGGRRPLDIYRRIHQGIPGTPMAGFSTFSDEQIWDLVNYVLSVPFSAGDTVGTSAPADVVETAQAKTDSDKPR